MALQAQDKEIVVPGQVIATGMDFLPAQGTYRLGDEIRANRVGLLKVEGKVIKTIPLSGVYTPKKHDVVIGKISDILMSGWRMNLNSPYSSVLGLKDATFDFVSKSADLTKYFDLDDYAVVKIIQVTTQNLVDVSCKGPGLKKLVGGRIIKVSANKVPRIIGAQGSMITMVKRATECRIVVGQNGVIWINGEPEQEHKAAVAIKRIEELAHISGLTEKIKAELETMIGKKIEEMPAVVEEKEEAPPRREFGGDRGNFRNNNGGRRGPRTPRAPGKFQRPPRGDSQ